MNILPALASMDELTLYGICSRNSDIVFRTEKQWGCKAWTDVEQMLSDPHLDIVYLSTPIGLHAKQGMQVLKAGKHLWCEKPLTCDLADTRKLALFAEEMGLTLAEGFMYLYHPQFRYLQRFVAEKNLGSVKTVTCRFGIPFLENPGFRYDESLCGGAFFDVGSYAVSAVLALFPSEDPIVLYANISGNDDYEVDLEGSAKLYFHSGSSVYLEWGVGRGYRNEIDIWGEKGSLFTDKIFSKPADYVPEFRLRNLNGVESIEKCESDNHFVSMFRYFRKMVNDDTMVNERLRILRLAYYLEEIRHISQNEKANSKFK
jgi:predicted dehydrogenase